jgi:hypothetical protein
VAWLSLLEEDIDLRGVCVLKALVTRKPETWRYCNSDRKWKRAAKRYE